MSIRSCASPSSPTAHITFWTFDEVLRPQILSMARSSSSKNPLRGPPSAAVLFHPDRLDAALGNAHLAGGCEDRGPDLVREWDPVCEPLRAQARLGLARNEHFPVLLYRPRALHGRDISGDLARERRFRVKTRRVDVERQHAIGERTAVLRRSGAAERAAKQFADQRQTGALVVAECPDRTLAFAVVARPSSGLVISVEQMGIAADPPVQADQGIVRQFLAAAACHQHLAFGNDPCCEG